MQTDFAVNDPLAVKLWRKKLFVEAIQQCWFRNFISDKGDNVIQKFDDAEKGAGGVGRPALFLHEIDEAHGYASLVLLAAGQREDEKEFLLAHAFNAVE